MISARCLDHGVFAAVSNEAGQLFDTPGGQKHDPCRACWEHTRMPVGGCLGSMVSRDGFPQDRVVQCQFGNHVV